MKYPAIAAGEKFGHLTVVGVHRKDGRGDSYLCQCDCGNSVILCGSHLMGTPRRPANKSCGCAHDRQRGMAALHPRIYAAWREMVDRCYAKNSTNFKKYGANGISVCDEWRDEAYPFVQWALSHGYADDFELDRIDFTGNYSPENCRWVDEYIQAQNKGLSRNNKTGVKGVSYDKRTRKYKAYIMRYGTKTYLGEFKNLNDAAEARKTAEQRFVFAK